jgi:hypothetical protein
MSNYFEKNYISSIKLANLANEIGDYRCALKNYIYALDNLIKLQSNPSELLLSDDELNERINTLEKIKNKGKSILYNKKWLLTKSKFVIGKQCFKLLYLENDKEKKKEKTLDSQELTALYNRGHIFEDNFRNSEFPEGINVKDKVGNWGFFDSFTNYLLNLPGKQVIFEATIIEDDVLIMCDVLVKDENGKIDVYECKLYKEINNVILEDLSIQYNICRKRFGDILRSFNLVLRADEKGEEWVIQDITEELANSKSDVDASIQLFKEVIKNAEPSIEMGNHCDSPYECGFKAYCAKLNQ